jgi:hypothetical protein
MVAAIQGFDHSWESSKVVYTEYKNDKRANEILGLDRHQECKWFDQLDVWNSTHACVKNQKFQQVLRRVKMKAMKTKDLQNCKNLKLFQIRDEEEIPRQVRRDLGEGCVQFF